MRPHPIPPLDPAVELSAALIRRLQIAMSAQAMLDVLQHAWAGVGSSGEEPLDCQLVRVSPGLPHRFVLHYEVTTVCDDATHRSYLLLGELTVDEPLPHYRRALQKLRRKKRGQLTESPAQGGLAVLPMPGMVLRRAGYDERLLGLRLVHDPRLLQPILSEHVVGRHGTLASLESQMLAHRLGKRGVARFRYETLAEGTAASSRGSVIAKLYKARTNKGKRVFADMRRLRADGFDDSSPLKVAKPMAFLAQDNVVLMENVPGTILTEQPRDKQRDATVAAGRLLGKLHTSAFAPPRRHGVEDEIALLDRWTALTGQILPALRRPAAGAFVAVRAALDSTAGARLKPSHRDFYDTQILLTDRDATLIDFDTYCMADPALDIGNFLAHLELRRLQGEILDDGLADAFLEGYSRMAGELPRGKRVGAYKAATLLRLACLYSFSTRWQALAQPLIDIAHAALRTRQ